MNHTKPLFLLLLAVCTACCNSLIAQSIQFKADWEAASPIGTTEDPFGGAKAPWFKGALLDEVVPNLPYKDVWVEVAENEELVLGRVETQGEVRKQNGEMTRTSRGATAGQDGFYPAAHVVMGRRDKMMGKEIQHVRLYPIRVEPGSGATKQVNEIEVEYRKRAVAGAAASVARSNKTYASESVLSKGTWVRISIGSEGMYKVTRDDLSALGLNPSQVDPRTLRIYGYGGGMLPQEAGTHPYDDLVENPIWVSGEADGQFDGGDYLLFYGASPHTWSYNEILDRWTHQLNVYSDSSYYFLTYGQGNGLRVNTAPNPGPTSYTPTYTDQFSFREVDSYNPLGSGRYWLGETFDLDPSKDFEMAVPGMRPNSNAQLTLRVAARSQVSSQFAIREGGTNLGSISIGSVSFTGYSNYYLMGSRTFSLPASSLGDQVLNLNLNYSKPQTSSVGYLDFMEVQYEQALNFAGRPLWFFNAREGVGPGEVFEYNISGSANGYRIWDVTDPVRATEVPGASVAGKWQIRVAADSIKRFAAFSDAGIRRPTALRLQNKQNLHGLSAADYLIISPSSLFPAAERLANLHRQEFGRTVHIVRPQQIYNEFSAGRTDPTAIRDYVKMFYDRWLDQGGVQPRYVLLMGDGSYDIKGISNSKSLNLVPTYQARNSHHAMFSYISDDFYGFLDDGEGFWGENVASSGSSSDILYYVSGDTLIQAHSLDVSVGRISAENLEEANVLVDKIIDYRTNPDAMGTWRNRVLLVADHLDREGNLHAVQAESYTDDIEASNPCMNIDKLFMDNYLMEPTASGHSFPEGKEAVFNALNEGALVANYTGHGGETGWSNASILTISDINNLENGLRMPAFMTATCEFGRWDDPQRRSGAEQLVLNPNGGAIAMFTTVRVVEAGSNKILNENFYNEVFKWDAQNGRWPTMGEVFMRTKNRSWLGGGINNRNFSLLGDPGLPLAYPAERAVVTSINGRTVQQGVTDSLATMSHVTVEGEVQDANGVLLTGYDGELSVTVYDKPNRFTTRRRPFNFFWQKSRIFNGTATVKDGKFRFEFVVPLDVSYDAGSGKMSLYVQNGQTDGAGCYREFFMGGSDSTSLVDQDPPELRIYMNDEKFVDGGLVGSNPTLIAEVYDENGINTAGTGIGHDLTAVLDGDDQNIAVLNNFYEALKDNYQEGVINYPYQDLAEGEHRLEVKVWDVANNSSDATLTFVVADDAGMALGHVLNYPNPFTTNTKFYVEHNLNGHALNVQVKVFTVSGRLVKTLEDSFYAEGNLYCDLEWDGLDEYGDAIGRGVYVYQVSVKDEVSGEKINRFEKLVLLR